MGLTPFPVVYRILRLSGPGEYTGTRPPLAFDWSVVLDDPGSFLLITEGELKAATTVKHGIPCIGLGGVFNFASKRYGLEWIPSLDRVVWKGRKVYIAFDSDADKNPMVRLAETRLALLLKAREAEVHVLRLPAQADGTKAGLDDYLIEHGKASLKKLIDEAKPWNKDLPLHELNTEVAYCHNPNSVVRLRDFFVMNTKDFRADHYAARKHLVGEPGKEKSVATAKAWMEWDSRLVVDGITFAPGSELITNNQLNLWTGWGGTPEEGPVNAWDELVALVLHGAHPDHVQWFRQWAAYRFRHPLARINSAVLIWGPQGTGKTKLGEYLAALHGTHAHELSQRSLAGNFNSWMKHKTFILGDEVTTRESKRSLAEEMKNWITRDSVEVNEKFIREYKLPNYAQFFLTSNHHNALALEKGDRRYFVHKVTAPQADDKTFTRLGRWKKEQKNINALLHHFMHEVDCASFNPHEQPPVTEDKNEVIRASMSDAEAWADQLAADADDPNHEGLRHLYTPTELLDLAQRDGGRGSGTRPRWAGL